MGLFTEARPELTSREIRNWAKGNRKKAVLSNTEALVPQAVDNATFAQIIKASIPEQPQRIGKLSLLPIGGGAVETRETPDVNTAKTDFDNAQANLAQKEKEASSLKGTFNRGFSRLRGKKARETQELEDATENYNAARRNLAAAEISEDLRQDAQWHTFDVADPDYATKMGTYRDLAADRYADRLLQERREKDLAAIKAENSRGWLFRKFYGDWKKRMVWGWGVNAGIGLAVASGAAPVATVLLGVRLGMGAIGTKGMLDGLDDKFRDDLKAVPDVTALRDEQIAQRAAALRAKRIRDNVEAESATEAALLAEERNRTRTRIKGVLDSEDIQDIASLRTAAPATANFYAAVEADANIKAYNEARNREKLREVGKGVGAVLISAAITSLPLPHILHIGADTVYGKYLDIDPNKHLLHVLPFHAHWENIQDSLAGLRGIPVPTVPGAPVVPGPTVPNGTPGVDFTKFENPDPLAPVNLGDPRAANLSYLRGLAQAQVAVNDLGINQALGADGPFEPNSPDKDKQFRHLTKFHELWEHSGGGKDLNDQKMLKVEEVMKGDSRNNEMIRNLRQVAENALRVDPNNAEARLIANHPNTNADFIRHFNFNECSHDLASNPSRCQLNEIAMPNRDAQRQLYDQVKGGILSSRVPATPTRGLGS
jgi:hypothetical protein